MGKLVKRLAIIVAVLLIAFLGYAATLPDVFRVQRTVSVKASPEKIVGLINDFHNWITWSPYEKMDPAMKRTYSGAESGKGAIYQWEGNDQVGQGRMEILQTSPSKVTIQLDFMEPFQARNTAEFTLKPEGETTKVTWAMYGPNPYMAKVMHFFCNMDEMVGKDFETGLHTMKAMAEDVKK